MRSAAETESASRPGDVGASSQPREDPARKSTDVGDDLDSKPVTWASLPHKDQLLILFLGRFVDFLQFASLQTYVFFQLRDIDPSLSDAEISAQAGVLQGCFTGAQVATAFLWGKAADARWCGRKNVLLIGLGGTALSCAGYGFVTTFYWAAFWRMFGGAVNGTVGIIRTMVSEVTKERKYQSRAFLLLPLSFNTAQIFGPVMGGLFANAANTLPGLFGEGAIFGFQWIRDYPYALPSLVNAFTLALCTIWTWLFLRETLETRLDDFDLGLSIGNRIKQAMWGSRSRGNYRRISDAAQDLVMEEYGSLETELMPKPVMQGILPFRRIWTRNVIFTLITGAFFDFQLGAFTNIWSLFLATPRYESSRRDQTVTVKRSLPLLFTGGLGMPASTVGVASSILGWLGMLLQLFFYPRIQARLGTLRSFRYFLPVFALCYFLAPFIAVLPSTSPAPAAASGPFVWTGITLVLLLQTSARTVTMPANIMLINNSSPHPSVLGTIHGLGQSVSALSRTIGPVLGGKWYGAGLEMNMVAWGWWLVAAMSGLGGLSALMMHEGSGHEIYLPGERTTTDQ